MKWSNLMDTHIQVNHLNAYYNNNHQALKEINLSIPKKQITVIMGPSGCGKTTLLKTLNRFLELTDDTRVTGQVLIDGAEVIGLPDGTFTAPGWDRPGVHEVWCHSASKSYSIELGVDQWEAWNAYRWSHGDESYPVSARSPAICGVTVRPPADRECRDHSVTVPASNRLLVGAEPGQVRLCDVRGDLRCGECVAFLPFEPVWALPADPWHCDKRTARIIPMGDQPAGPIPVGPGSRRRGPVDQWCDAILAASRKGLLLSTADRQVRQLWRGYRRAARRIWRSRR